MNKMKIIQGDCLEKMKDIPDKSIDMVLADLPYGTTACKWDTIIPFEPLWEQYKRIIKDNGAIVLFGSEPFSSKLRLSNLEMFKYDWIWEKTKGGGFMTAKKIPLKRHEIISIFYKKQPIYNFIKTLSKKIDKRKKINNPIYKKQDTVIKVKSLIRKKDDGSRFPISVIKFNSVFKKGQHPTQKPVTLLEYLIKTYTNENDLVLDNCMGSGSTGIACLNTNRNFIGIELDEKYFEIAKNRIENHKIQGNLTKQ